MNLYTIIITIVAVICFVNSLKWKIGTMTVLYFCADKFREPTDKEIADYKEKVFSKLLKRK